MNTQEKKEEISRRIKKIFEGKDKAFENVVRELIFKNKDIDIKQVMHKYMPETIEIEKHNLSKTEALFNGHINNAEDRAIRRFKAEFSEEVFQKELKPYFDKGILSIFYDRPNDYTLWFVNEVQKIVNKGE